MLEQAWHRLDNSPTQEHVAALLEIAKIANHRLADVVEDTTPMGSVRAAGLQRVYRGRSCQLSTSFNQADADTLRPACWHSPRSRWADPLLAGRPFDDLDAVLATSDELVRDLDEPQIDAALAGHPRIGERRIGGVGARAAGMSRAESRSGRRWPQATPPTRSGSGGSTWSRPPAAARTSCSGCSTSACDNDPGTELDVVRGELARITRLRLTSLLAEL